MATLAIKGMPDDLYDLLKQRAKAHRRSINAEVIRCIELAVRSQRIDPDAFLARVALLRDSTNYPELTDKALEQYRSEGRA